MYFKDDKNTAYIDNTNDCNIAKSTKHPGNVWLGISGLTNRHISQEQAADLRDALNHILSLFGPNEGYVQRS